VNDLRVIDILIFKGRAEYQEVANVWKLETHVMSYFDKEESLPKPQTFLQNFFGNL
jgi:NADH dehydrogenase (ubiquinone) 1 alpha subcomplex subunit 6